MISRDEQGFTLIELLVVIAILGILAAVVVPVVGSFIGEGENESFATEKQNMQLAVTAMMSDVDTVVADFSSDPRIDW